jgi:hypothetical protein
LRARCKAIDEIVNGLKFYGYRRALFLLNAVEIIDQCENLRPYESFLIVRDVNVGFGGRALPSGCKRIASVAGQRPCGTAAKRK